LRPTILRSTFRILHSPEWRWVVWAAIAVVLLSSLSYAIVAMTTPADVRFGGALVNAFDGQSYLAKMRQGYDGGWLFRLPFTASDEADAFLFTYHIALGHFARLTGLSLVTVYHLARAVGGWALLLTVYTVMARVFDTVADRRRAWGFVALTSGLGWLDINATDVTIPESNTFFSILANAHFAASMALMLIIFMAVMDGRVLRAAAASFALAILQPFAPIVVYASMMVSWMVSWLVKRVGCRLDLRRQVRAALVAGLCIAPLMVYFYAVTQHDPTLQDWSAQNFTPSPSPLEFVAGYGLMGALAIPGARLALKRGRNVDVLLVAWAVTSALLLYAPFPLQRRFSLGLHIPIVVLAAMTLSTITVSSRISAMWRRWLPRLAFIVALPTTLFLLIATSTAALHAPDVHLFFSANEAAAFEWLRESAPHDSVVLAAPETGLFLPAWADVRVLYGHPFETVDADAMKLKVEQFFAGENDRADVIREHGVDYIFFGPRERKLGTPESSWQAVFNAGDVAVYRAP